MAPPYLTQNHLGHSGRKLHTTDRLAMTTNAHEYAGDSNFSDSNFSQTRPSAFPASHKSVQGVGSTNEFENDTAQTSTPRPTTKLPAVDSSASVNFGKTTSHSFERVASNLSSQSPDSGTLSIPAHSFSQTAAIFEPPPSCPKFTLPRKSKGITIKNSKGEVVTFDDKEKKFLEQATNDSSADFDGKKFGFESNRNGGGSSQQNWASAASGGLPLTQKTSAPALFQQVQPVYAPGLAQRQSHIFSPAQTQSFQSQSPSEQFGVSLYPYAHILREQYSQSQPLTPPYGTSFGQAQSLRSSPSAVYFNASEPVQMQKWPSQTQTQTAPGLYDQKNALKGGLSQSPATNLLTDPTSTREFPSDHSQPGSTQKHIASSSNDQTPLFPSGLTQPELIPAHPFKSTEFRPLSKPQNGTSPRQNKSKQENTPHTTIAAPAPATPANQAERAAQAAPTTQATPQVTSWQKFNAAISNYTAASASQPVSAKTFTPAAPTTTTIQTTLTGKEVSAAKELLATAASSASQAAPVTPVAPRTRETSTHRSASVAKEPPATTSNVANAVVPQTQNTPTTHTAQSPGAKPDPVSNQANITTTKSAIAIGATQAAEANGSSAASKATPQTNSRQISPTNANGVIEGPATTLSATTEKYSAAQAVRKTPEDSMPKAAPQISSKRIAITPSWSTSATPAAKISSPTGAFLKDQAVPKPQSTAESQTHAAQTPSHPNAAQSNSALARASISTEAKPPTTITARTPPVESLNQFPAAQTKSTSIRSAVTPVPPPTSAETRPVTTTATGTPTFQSSLQPTSSQSKYTLTNTNSTSGPSSTSTSTYANSTPTAAHAKPSTTTSAETIASFTTSDTNPTTTAQPAKPTLEQTAASNLEAIRARIDHLAFEVENEKSKASSSTSKAQNLAPSEAKPTHPAPKTPVKAESSASEYSIANIKRAKTFKDALKYVKEASRGAIDEERMISAVAASFHATLTPSEKKIQTIESIESEIRAFAAEAVGENPLGDSTESPRPEPSIQAQAQGQTQVQSQTQTQTQAPSKPQSKTESQTTTHTETRLQTHTQAQQQTTKSPPSRHEAAEAQQITNTTIQPPSVFPGPALKPSLTPSLPSISITASTSTTPKSNLQSHTQNDPSKSQDLTHHLPPQSQPQSQSQPKSQSQAQVAAQAQAQPNQQPKPKTQTKSESESTSDFVALHDENTSLAHEINATLDKLLFTCSQMLTQKKRKVLTAQAKKDHRATETKVKAGNSTEEVNGEKV